METNLVINLPELELAIESGFGAISFYAAFSGMIMGKILAWGFSGIGRSIRAWLERKAAFGGHKT